MRTFTYDGFTMLELLLTLTILSAVGMLAVPTLSRHSDQAASQTTRQSMAVLRGAIMTDYRTDMFESLPYPADPARAQHPQLKYLYDNPISFAAANPDSIEATSAWTYDASTGRGWSGPYVDHAAGMRARYQANATHGFTSVYGETGDPSPVDGWCNPIVLQQPITSGGMASAKNLNHARLVSAGEDGVLQTPIDVMEPTLAQTGDDILVYLRGR